MQDRAGGAIEVEAQLRAPSAEVQLVHYRFARPPQTLLRVEDKFRIELALTSRHRSARACFCDKWGQHRFERIGDLFIVPPGVSMLTRSDEEGPLAAIVCEFKADLILQFIDRLPQLNEALLIHALDIRNAKVQGLLLRLAEELRQPGYAGEMLVELITREMALELVRDGTAHAEHETRGGLAGWQLRAIEERLNEIRETPTLDVLARVCRISVRQLARGFRLSRGMPIGSYVAKSQMEHAKKLLAAGETLTSIAGMLGFSSPSNFCAAFRREMGMTPGRFRETLLRH